MKDSQSYKLAAKRWNNEQTIIEVNGHRIGGDSLLMIAGPCAIESEEQIETISSFISRLGVSFIRGGAYKPRTSPYSFQGLGDPGLKIIKDAAKRHNLSVVTEVMDLSLLDEVYPNTDILQVGSRNMKNYFFLKELGKTDKPILLKRGMDATIEEWLLAAEYILLGGNERVILCERGIRTFDNSSRNTLDTNGIALAKQLSHLPVLADPSQATGNRDLVRSASLASVAAGADGLMIEVHNNPDEALSDGPQSLYPEQFEKLLGDISKVAFAVGKNVSWKKTPEMVNV
ncbi:MAG: 3-deoxy-7-phosphoheptulonate synthase [Bacteroidetes bacterium]|nr:3-deoxy-7-phosphoheptulonate synthase [Bacteroidota bacterium]